MMVHRNMARRKNLAMKAVKPTVKPVEKPVMPEEPMIEVEKPEFTREEVEKMPYMKLKSVAKKHDIDTEDVDAKEVRSNLIEKLGL